MKRFYCTICKKTKRVRIIPANVTTPEAYDVNQRTGTCSWHIRGTWKQSNPAQENARFTRKVGA